MTLRHRIRDLARQLETLVAPGPDVVAWYAGLCRTYADALPNDAPDAPVFPFWADLLVRDWRLFWTSEARRPWTGDPIGDAVHVYAMLDQYRLFGDDLDRADRSASGPCPSSWWALVALGHARGQDELWQRANARYWQLRGCS